MRLAWLLAAWAPVIVARADYNAIAPAVTPSVDYGAIAPKDPAPEPEPAPVPIGKKTWYRLTTNPGWYGFGVLDDRGRVVVEWYWRAGMSSPCRTAAFAALNSVDQFEAGLRRLGADPTEQTPEEPKR